MRIAALVSIALVGCAPPQPQLLLYAVTDAPLPPPPGLRAATGEPPPLFDRLRIEVFAPGESTVCKNCTREFALDRALVAEGRASAGIAFPPGVAGYRARLRLYRALPLLADEPPPEATVETVVALPPLEGPGVTEVSASLLVETVGRPVGTLDAPVVATVGRAAPLPVWAGARRVGCADPAPKGMVCVPGGAFWMGSPLAGEGSERQRLVVLSPFYLDATEVRVKAMRESGLAGEMDPVGWTGESTGMFFNDWCTYSTRRDDYPLNCVTWSKAREFCQFYSGDLPSEAQFEYAAGALESRLYVWGSDEPECGDAAYQRSGVPSRGATGCAPLGTQGGVLPSGMSGARDVLAVPGGKIVDLAGNLSEFMRDQYNGQDEPCWRGAGVYRDPVCDEIGAMGAVRSLRGGSWALVAQAMHAAFKVGLVEEEIPHYGLGFRCVQTARPAP